MLLSKAGIYCAQQRIARIAIGPLAGNPFPDATPEFFASMARTLSLGLAHDDRDRRAVLARMHKSDVVRLGLELGVPLELTLSCMNPRAGVHCGQCSKCRERRDAFLRDRRVRSDGVRDEAAADTDGYGHRLPPFVIDHSARDERWRTSNAGSSTTRSATAPSAITP